MEINGITAPNGRKITPKKMLVIKEGMKPNGGSIKAVTKMMNRTEANTRLHVYQCKKMYGYDYQIEGDRYWIFSTKSTG